MCWLIGELDLLTTLVLNLLVSLVQSFDVLPCLDLKRPL